MKESDAQLTTPPSNQKMERELSLRTEHKDAMERALLLDVPHVASLEESSEDDSASPLAKISSSRDSISSGKSEWDDLVDVLLHEEGHEDLVHEDKAVWLQKGARVS